MGSCGTLCRLMAAARACYEDQGEASRRLASSTDASILFRPRTVSELRWNPRLVLYGVHRVVDDLHEAEADDELVLDDVVDLGCKHGLHEALPVRDDCAVPVGGPCPDFFHGEALPIIVSPFHGMRASASPSSDVHTVHDRAMHLHDWLCHAVCPADADVADCAVRELLHPGALGQGGLCVCVGGCMCVCTLQAAMPSRV